MPNKVEQQSRESVMLALYCRLYLYLLFTSWGCVQCFLSHSPSGYHVTYSKQPWTLNKPQSFKNVFSSILTLNQSEATLRSAWYQTTHDVVIQLRLQNKWKPSTLPASDVLPLTASPRVLLWWMLTKSQREEVGGGGGSWRKCAFAITGTAAMWRCIQGPTKTKQE